MADAEHNLIDALADEFLERLQRGETPSISEYEQAHPECAEEIRRVLSSVQMIEQMAKRRVSKAAIRGCGDSAAGAAGRLPDHARDRPRRHGGGLRGRAGVAGPPRGRQGAAPPVAARLEIRTAVCPRGADGGQAAPHEHRARVRRRPGRRLSLLRDATDRRSRAGRRVGPSAEVGAGRGGHTDRPGCGDSCRGTVRRRP